MLYSPHEEQRVIPNKSYEVNKMNTPKVFESEYKFLCILWENEPINSTALVKLCKERLGWVKGATYTVIKRLTERGVVKHEDTIVSTLVTKEEVRLAEFDELLTNRFEGSMPAFLATFSKKQKLSEKQIQEILQIIQEGGEEP